MKLTGLSGTGTGKLGTMVFSVNSGEQIVRQYQPNVSNPNTEAQVDQRAKLKLMSQLAASLAPVIVIPKDGLKSSRNQFIAKNFRHVSADNGTAQITIENVQLTNGNAGLPAIEASRAPESGVSISLAERADGAISRVVYIMYAKTSENTLQYVQSVIAEAAGDNGVFPASLVYTTGDIVLFAYGMKDLSARARANYTDLNAASGEDIASLMMTRSIKYGDYQFTQTRGATMFAGENSITSVPEGSARVFVTATAGGSATGAGIFEIGQQVNVVATPAQDFAFVGWRLNGTNTIVSSNPNYSFTLEGQTDLVAVFRSTAAATSYTITVQSENDAYGTVSGGGEIEAGQQVTITATKVDSKAEFLGWKEQGTTTYLSTVREYTFTPNRSMVIIAEWDYTEE